MRNGAGPWRATDDHELKTEMDSARPLHQPGYMSCTASLTQSISLSCYEANTRGL